MAGAPPLELKREVHGGWQERVDHTGCLSDGHDVDWLAALVGIFRYSASARLATLPPITNEPAPGLAVAHRRPRAQDRSTTGVTTSGVEMQRIRVLESMLEEKTQRLRQQSEQLKAKTTEYEDLRARYDETVLLAVDSLEHRFDAKAVAEKPADAEATPGQKPIRRCWKPN